MIIEVKVPQLSESVAEATLSAWHVKEGDAVARDQNLIDIETDKVVLELPAPDAGVIVKIIKQNGETVASGEVIAQIDTEGQGCCRGARCRQARCRPGRRTGTGRQRHGDARRAQDHG
jgi:2-oxoglutarate dehydrogenase E2 component (dihydrolipoamide succinyltransferase)